MTLLSYCYKGGRSNFCRVLLCFVPCSRARILFYFLLCRLRWSYYLFHARFVGTAKTCDGFETSTVGRGTGDMGVNLNRHRGGRSVAASPVFVECAQHSIVVVIFVRSALFFLVLCAHAHRLRCWCAHVAKVCVLHWFLLSDCLCVS